MPTARYGIPTYLKEKQLATIYLSSKLDKKKGKMVDKKCASHSVFPPGFCPFSDFPQFPISITIH